MRNSTNGAQARGVKSRDGFFGVRSSVAGGRTAAGPDRAKRRRRAACLPFAKNCATVMEPVPWMLEASIVLQLAIGERVEALIVAALLIFNIALGVFQEGRASEALAALKSRLALMAFARRDSKWIEIPAADLSSVGR